MQLWSGSRKNYKALCSLYNINRPCIIYQTCGPYKVWGSLYNINRPCMIYQTYEKIPDLWTLYGLIELQTLCNYDRPCKKIIRSGGLCEIVTSLPLLTMPADFIRSGGLCIIPTGLACFTRPVKNYQTCGVYKFSSPLQMFTGLINIMGLQHFITSGGRCTILSSPTDIVTTLVKINVADV